MYNRIMDYKDKNIAVFGLGITGKAVVNFLHKKEANVFVYDDKSFEEIDSEFLEKFTDRVSFVGTKRELGDVDLLVVSPGVKPSHIIYQNAIAKNIPIKNDINLFLDEWDSRGPVVGVTGSNGKSTVVTLLYEAVKSAGENVFLAGNIGDSPLDFFDKEIKDGTIVVLELSNYQLELFDENYFVDVAIITNISDNHLDRYNGSITKYAGAKLNILKPGHTKLVTNFDNQGIQRYILPSSVATKCETFFVSIKEEPQFIKNDGVYMVGEKLIIKESGEEKVSFENVNEVALIGVHNLYNIACVLEVVNLLGIDVSKVESKVREFKGLEHRIEYVDTINDIKYINDSKSTSPDATAKALDAVANKKNVILISGGDSKGVEYSSLKDYFNEFVKYLILLPGDAGEKFIKISSQFGIPYKEVPSMKKAVSVSVKIAEPGDIVLLSPGTSSLNLFKGFEDRGEQFKDLVNKIKK